jgi:hypothetical protein
MKNDGKKVAAGRRVRRGQVWKTPQHQSILTTMPPPRLPGLEYVLLLFFFISPIWGKFLPVLFNSSSPFRTYGIENNFS